MNVQCFYFNILRFDLGFCPSDFKNVFYAWKYQPTSGNTFTQDKSWFSKTIERRVTHVQYFLRNSSPKKDRNWNTLAGWQIAIYLANSDNCFMLKLDSDNQNSIEVFAFCWNGHGEKVQDDSSWLDNRNHAWTFCYMSHRWCASCFRYSRST